MKLYISVDMEGIAGTSNWKQETTNRSSVRKYMTQQLEWIIEGIHSSDSNQSITEIVIADSHNLGDNILYEISDLDNRIHLISGYDRPQYMMPAFDDEYDLVFFAGYHAGIGAIHANMDHSYSASSFHNIWINNIPMNESLINAAYAGFHFTPVGLIIGDHALSLELEKTMPWINYVTTKYALSKNAAKHRPVDNVKQDTLEAVKKTLDADIKNIPLYRFDTPIQLKIELATTAKADNVALMPSVQRIDGRTVIIEHDNYQKIFDAIMAVCLLASTA